MDENSGAFEKKEETAAGEQPGGKRLMPETAETAKKKRGALRALLIGAGAVAAVYLGVCCWAHFSGRIYPNVTFAGLELGGMTQAQAAETIGQNLANATDATVSFRLADDGSEVARIDLGTIALDADAADIARVVYRTWGGGESFLAGGAGFFGALVSGRSVSIGSYDEAFAPAAAQLRAALERAPTEFSAEVTEGGEVRITKAANGRRVVAGGKNDPIAALVREAYFAGGTETVLLETTDAEGGVYEVVPAQHVDLEEERGKLLGEKVNASYDKETGEIVPESVGVAFSLSTLADAYEAAAAGETFTLDAEVTLPEVTAAELEKCLFRDELSSYTTRVGGAEGRHKNVQLTAGRIDGYILNAGETMKYGPLVTPFTAANGYYPAPGYFQGKTVDMYGGGACQASSTLYAAAIYANLEIVQRINHGFASDYIGLGLDATVAEGGPEFEFRNSTLYPIKVRAEFYTKDGKDYIKVTLLGTKTDDSYVKIVTEVLETIPFGEQIVESEELAPGERKVEQTAYTGYKVKTYRNVYAGDGTLISSALEARSNYKARDRIVLVGKGTDLGELLPDGGETVLPDGETVLPDGGTESTPAPEEPVIESEMPEWLRP